MSVPEGMVPCDKVLLCINPDTCPDCSQNDPHFPSDFTPAPLIKGRHYRASARTPDESPEQAWWITELDSEPVVYRCDCGRHFGLGWVMRCACHFGEIDEEQIPEVLEMIKGIDLSKPTEPKAPVKVPEKEDA